MNGTCAPHTAMSMANHPTGAPRDSRMLRRAAQLLLQHREFPGSHRLRPAPLRGRRDRRRGGIDPRNRRRSRRARVGVGDPHDLRARSLHVGERVRARRRGARQARRPPVPDRARHAASANVRRSKRRSCEASASASIEQQRWMNDDLRVPELYHYLLRNAAQYRALVFAPYLFWTTFACGMISPERTIIQPCLHDEPQADARAVPAVVLRRARRLVQLGTRAGAGASRLFTLPSRQRVVGSGVHVPDSYDPDGLPSPLRDRRAVRAVRGPARRREALGVAARRVRARGRASTTSRSRS